MDDLDMIKAVTHDEFDDRSHEHIRKVFARRNLMVGGRVTTRLMSDVRRWPATAELNEYLDFDTERYVHGE